MFRNLRLYRLPNGISATPEQLTTQLLTGLWRNCGASEGRSAGWFAPTKDCLVYAQADQRLLSYQIEEKILPANYVARVVQAKADAIEEERGSQPGRKELRDIKEMVISALIPQAFTKMIRIPVWIDNKNGWMAIGGSQSRCEDVITSLNRCMAMIPQIALPRTVGDPAGVMTRWLAEGECPGDFTIDRDCELVAHTESCASVRYSNSNLDTDDIRDHIATGKTVARIALTWRDRISFVLTDSLEIKRIQMLDILKEESRAQAEDAQEQFAADFTIYTGELSRLIRDVVQACGGEAPDIDQKQAA